MPSDNVEVGGKVLGLWQMEALFSVRCNLRKYEKLSAGKIKNEIPNKVAERMNLAGGQFCLSEALFFLVPRRRYMSGLKLNPICDQ